MSQKTNTEVVQPGVVVHGSLESAVPVAVLDTDRETFRREMERVDRAERVADEEGRRIRVH